MENRIEQQTGIESKAQLVEQINTCLHAGQYSRALDLLRGAAAEFPNDAHLSELEKLAHDGLNRNAEAQHLITESQELFAQRKSAAAIQLLRKAYELDKHNSLARSILANALVEQAQSVVETDWLESEKLTNQALALNPAHPTAKTILGKIVIKKETSPVTEWVAQARKLQTSGDMFAALAWVAEGLAVHPHEPKLLQIQDEIQRDQEAQRRQARRGDLDELRRLQREIEGAVDGAAKQALAESIQALAAKHWTDGEILSIANALLLRLGLVAKESSGGSSRSKGATLILHVPRPSAPKPAPADTSPVAPAKVSTSSEVKVSRPPDLSSPPLNATPPNPAPSGAIVPTQVLPGPVAPDPVVPDLSGSVPTNDPVGKIPTSRKRREKWGTPSGEDPAIAPPAKGSPSITPPSKVPVVTAPPSNIPLRSAPRGKVRGAPPKPLPPQPATVLPEEPPAAEAKVALTPPQPKEVKTSKSTTLIFATVAAIVLIAATFFFTRRYYASPAKISAAAPDVSAPPASAAPTTSAPVASVPIPDVSAPVQPAPEPAQPEPRVASETATPKIAPAKPSTVDGQPPTESHSSGALVVIAGQDGARVFLNGKPLAQLTRSGQLRLPNLEPKDYVVQVSKSGFQDPPPQKIRIRKDQQAQLVFNLQPQARLASLTIRGGAPGTTVLVDQTPVGTIQPDGTLSVSTVNPGDHTLEFRKDRFKPRQLKKHFVAGETISLAAADTTLEAAPAELKITFTPADATVAISKGDLPTVVKNGVPVNLAAGTYTLTARTADRYTRSSTLEIIAGQSRSLNLSLAPNGMSKWDDPSAWKQEGNSFTRKGGDFVLYGVAPASGTFAFSVMLTKGRLLQWVLDYTDSKNYVLCQMDDNYFYRAVIHNGEKTNDIRIPDKSDKKSFRELHIRVSATELVSQIRQGNSWTVLDRWTQPGTNLSVGKFGFYLPGSDQIELSNFAHYADLNIR